MMEEKDLPLWNKIQSFPMDDADAAITFSGKLAALKQWPLPFTQKAIEEYKKFIFLCCISEKGAAPSHIVDEVWHLHLTYTRSYWVEFCRNTLGKDIHHTPSAGGDQEDDKHNAWYRETLQLYRSVFGMPPPRGIWPPKEQTILVQEAPPLLRFGAGTILSLLIVLIPFLFSWMVYGTANPFSLNGHQFLRFFPLYGLAILIAYILSRYQVKKGVQDMAIAQFPEEASPFQLADFLYGKHRAVQAGIVDLLKRDLLELKTGNRFLVKRNNYSPLTDEINPLIPAYAEEEEGRKVNYETIFVIWYDWEKFSHPSLEALRQFTQRREPFIRNYLFPLAFLGMPFLRGIQGLMNSRPIGFLVLQTIFLSFLFFLFRKRLSKRSLVIKKIEQLAKDRLQSLEDKDARLVPQFALGGLSAINGFAEGAMLASVFASYTPPPQNGRGINGWGSQVSAYFGSGSSYGRGSSCGSGGSSCGSSCGGGSGCGGCGGGGD